MCTAIKDIPSIVLEIDDLLGKGYFAHQADVAELVDALDSGSSDH